MKKEHQEQFKTAIAIVNYASALEECTREMSGMLRLKPKMITKGSATSVKKVEPIAYINELTQGAISSLKELNEFIGKTFVVRKGRGDVNNMSYELNLMVKELYALNIDDQIDVFEFIKSKVKGNEMA